MDSAVIAAIIEAVAIVAGSGIHFEMWRRKNAQIRRAESGARSIHELIEDRWGFSVGLAKTKVIVENPDGLTYLKMERRGTKAHNLQLLQIPGRAFTDHPEGVIVQEPRLTYTSPRNARDIDMKVSEIGKSRKLCEFTIDIIGGGLTDGEGELDYDYEVAFSRMFSMTKEELDALGGGTILKREYFCHEVTFPTDTIELEVEFPEGYPIETHFAVFAGATEFINSAELQSKKSCFEQTPRGGYFKIEKPLLGFRYAIFWMPPSQERFEVFKQEFEKRKE